MLVRVEVGALKAMDPRGRKQAAEQWVFTAPLDSAAPALVASDVDHWREGPVDSGPGRFESSSLGRSPGKVGFEARDFRERNGEDRSMPVDDVRREHHRDLQAGLLDGSALHDPRHARAIAVEDAGQLSLTRLVHLLLEIAPGAGRVETERRSASPGGRHDLQLTCLLLQVHAPDQLINEGGGFDLASRLQQCAGRARQPRGGYAGSHEKCASGNRQVQHQLPSKPCTDRARRSYNSSGFSAHLTLCVTGYMSHARSNCNRRKRDISPICGR